MRKSFNKKVAIVTGGGGAIGRQASLKLAQYGAQLSWSTMCSIEEGAAPGAAEPHNKTSQPLFPMVAMLRSIRSRT